MFSLTFLTSSCDVSKVVPVRFSKMAEVLVSVTFFSSVFFSIFTKIAFEFNTNNILFLFFVWVLAYECLSLSFFFGVFEGRECEIKAGKIN
jgi:hypothetical protein